MELVINWVFPVFIGLLFPVFIGLLFLAIYTQLCLTYGSGKHVCEPCLQRHPDEIKTPTAARRYICIHERLKISGCGLDCPGNPYY